MGGDVAVESSEEAGTSFTFSITCGISSTSRSKHVFFSTEGNEGKKVLVVDDNQTNLTILMVQLQQWKIYPTLTSSGKKALALLSSGEEFDLIISDMQMPEMDGVELAEKIRESYPALPIILLSSIGDDSNKKYPELFNAVLSKLDFRIMQHALIYAGNARVKA